MKSKKLFYRKFWVIIYADNSLDFHDGLGNKFTTKKQATDSIKDSFVPEGKVIRVEVKEVI